MFNDYEITMDSFGQDLPENWEEIAAYLNDIIDGYREELTTCSADEDGIEYFDQEEFDRRREALWEAYWAGELPDAPKPIE